MTIEFQGWPKTPRLMRDIVITEKLDGTNAAIGVAPLSETAYSYPGHWDDKECKPPFEDITIHDNSVIAKIEHEGTPYAVYAQSRTRLITPGKDTDNYGFAGWVEQNAQELVELLGEGLHYGEWWGAGIQRKYGMSEKHFALFNTHKHRDVGVSTDLNIAPVPLLYVGPHDTGRVSQVMEELAATGSVAAPGFMNPEGIIVYHSAARQSFKVTLDKNDAGKWEV